MQYFGVLKKMMTEFGKPVDYFLELGSDFIHMNQLIGKVINFKFESYKCLNCGSSKKIFKQGFCYDCSSSSAQVGDWIIHPELSKAHLGIEDRDLEYEKQVQLQPHILYLANSSDVKIGVTRKTQIPTRWIDQGAHEALEIAEVPNRYLAGIAEVALKDFVKDKTNWRTMLKNEIKDKDLKKIKNQLINHLPEKVKPYVVQDNEETIIHFPVETYPTKLKSLNLETNPIYNGKLTGIKGQYLIFEDQTVFNIRTYEGYVVSLFIKK